MPMPEGLRPTWEALSEEVVAVHSRWIIFRQLFGHSKQRLNLANECAAWFFIIVKATLLNDVQLTLSKLADPSTSRGGANATLDRLTKEISFSCPTDVAEKLTTLRDAYQSSCKRIKDRRNKQIAHYDKDTLLKQYENDATALPSPSRKEIEGALLALRLFMWSAEAYLTSTTTCFDLFVSHRDGEDLLRILQQGLRYQDLVDQGHIPHNDLENSNRCVL